MEVRNPPSRPGSDPGSRDQTGPTLPSVETMRIPLGRDTAPPHRTEGTCWSGCGFPVFKQKLNQFDI